MHAIRLTIRMIKELNRPLKQGIDDAELDWFVVGSWKAYPNDVGGRVTTAPEHVDEEMKALICDLLTCSIKKAGKPYRLPAVLSLVGPEGFEPPTQGL